MYINALKRKFIPSDTDEPTSEEVNSKRLRIESSVEISSSAEPRAKTTGKEVIETPKPTMPDYRVAINLETATQEEIHNGMKQVIKLLVKRKLRPNHYLNLLNNNFDLIERWKASVTQNLGQFNQAQLQSELYGFIALRNCLSSITQNDRPAKLVALIYYDWNFISQIMMQWTALTTAEITSLNRNATNDAKIIYYTFFDMWSTVPDVRLSAELQAVLKERKLGKALKQRLIEFDHLNEAKNQTQAMFILLHLLNNCKQ